MAAFVVEDGLLDVGSSVHVLVVGNSEDVAPIQNAIRAVSDGFEFDTCGTLQEAESRIHVRDYDVTVLALPLSDAWAADAYSRLRESDTRSEVLVLLNAADDVAPMKGVERPPFAILVKSHTTAELMGRLLLSAVLYKRAFDDAPDALAHSNRSRG